MKLNEVEAHLVPWYLTSTAPGGPSFHLESAPGRGKSFVIEGAPDKLNSAFAGKKFGVVIINCAGLTLSGASGYLWPEEKDGHRYSQFTRPVWWETEEGLPLEAYDGGIIFADEIDKADGDIKKIMGEGAYAKRLANHRFPKGWVMWFAGNRHGKDRSGSTRDLDHLINRRITIPIQDDLQSLMDWQERNGISPEVKVFTRENPNVVFMNAPEIQGPYCTPRSLAQADAFLRSMSRVHGWDKVPVDPLLEEQVAGGIGSGAARQLFVTIQLSLNLPDYDKVVKHPDTTEVPDSPSAQRLMTYKLAAKVDEKDMKPVVTYVSRLPKEFNIIFGHSAVKRDAKLLKDATFQGFLKQHRELINAMSQVVRS